MNTNYFLKPSRKKGNHHSAELKIYMFKQGNHAATAYARRSKIFEYMIGTSNNKNLELNMQTFNTDIHTELGDILKDAVITEYRGS